jgi:hypothetical protein
MTAAVAQVEGQRFVTVTSSSGESATTSVKLAPPFVARLEQSRIDVAPPVSGSITPPPVKFAVVLDNRVDRAAKLGVVGGTTSVCVVVPARQKLTVPVTIPVSGRVDGFMTAPIRVLKAGRPVETLTATIGTLARSRFAAVLPRINADLSEWPEAEKLPLRPALRDRRGSLSSLSGQAMTLWDEHALYVAISLADADGSSEAVPIGTGAGPPEVQISLASGKSTSPESIVYSADLARTGPRLYRAGAARGPGALVPGARVAARRDGQRTIYELAIPWTEVGGFTPRAGEKLAVAIRISDIRGRGRPGLEFYGANPGDSPASLPAVVLTRP